MVTADGDCRILVVAGTGDCLVVLGDVSCWLWWLMEDW